MMSSTPANPMTALPERPALAARLRHRIQGRVRLGLVSPLPDRAALGACAEAMAAVEGVENIEIRLSTASLLIRHEGDFEPIAARLASAGLLLILPELPEPPFDPVRETVQQLESADATLMGATSGSMDLRKAIFMGLVAAGLVQIARGRIAGPALTLFSQAAALMATLGPPGGGKR